jgi:hypothetical protein
MIRFSFLNFKFFLRNDEVGLRLVRLCLKAACSGLGLLPHLESLLAEDTWLAQ